MRLPSVRSTALLLSFLLVLLAACGGGGGSSSPYTGTRSPATITADNAATLALDVYDAGVSSGSLSGDVPLAPAGPAATRAALRGAAAARSVVALATQGVPPPGGLTAQGTRQTVDDTQYDGLGGSVRLRGSVDDVSGDFSLALTATNWHGDSGGILDGTMRATGQIQLPIVDPNNPVFVRMEISFSALTYTDAFGSGTINGSIGFENYDRSTLFVELFLTDNVAKKTVWLHDVVLTGGGGSDLGGSYTTGSISGRIYLHDFGYVDVATPTPFKTYLGDTNPVQGELTITGALGRKVYLLVPDPDGADYEVGVDTDANGTWDVLIDGYWPDTVV